MRSTPSFSHGSEKVLASPARARGVPRRLDQKMAIDRVARTEKVLAEVSDWALRLARNIDSSPTFVESLAKAANGLRAVQLDLQVPARVAGRRGMKEQHRQDLIWVGCAIVAALAELPPPPAPEVGATPLKPPGRPGDAADLVLAES